MSAKCESDRLGSAVDAELREHALEVRDLALRAALSQEVEHLSLPPGEYVEQSRLRVLIQAAVSRGAAP